MDIICLSETYLDSTMQSDNDNLEIPGYNCYAWWHLHILQSIVAC